MQVRLDPENRRRWLWGLSACLLVGLAVTVVILGKAGAEAGQAVVLPAATFQAVLGGLVGLVVLFVMYVSMQQEQLHRWETEVRQRAMHEELLRARLNELAALLDVSGELSRQLNLRSVLEVAVRRLLPCLEADHASILLIDPRRNVLEQAASVGKRAGADGPDPIHPGAGVLGHVFESREILTVESQEARAALGRELGLAGTPCSAVCTPIVFENTCLGVLCVARVDVSEAFTAMHARALHALAEQCGAAIVRHFDRRRGGQATARAA
jgi:transcriptional regulator with GAF, ATPase, and Fis domain